MRSEAALGRPDRGGLAELAELAEQVRPVTLSREQRLPVLPAFEGLLPGAGLRRGATVSIGTAPGVGGATSLALALVAEASRVGSWVAAVGLPSLGLVAADELGVALERLVLVAAPERDAWGGVVAALVDGFDLVDPPRRSDRCAARRRPPPRGPGPGAGSGAAAARARAGPRAPTFQLQVTQQPLGGPRRRSRPPAGPQGPGHPRGRGEAAQPRRVDLWLPGTSGLVEAVEGRARGGRAAAAPLRAVG